MFSLTPSTLRSGSAACLIFGLAVAGETLLPGASSAGQPRVSPCQQSLLVASADPARTQSSGDAASTAASGSGSWLAQALPSQQPGSEAGEPACTYDPLLPAKPQIIRGLW